MIDHLIPLCAGAVAVAIAAAGWGIPGAHVVAGSFVLVLLLVWYWERQRNARGE